MAKPFRTIKRSATTPTVSRAKLAEAVRRVAADPAAARGAADAGVLRQPSVIVATAAAAKPRRATASVAAAR